MSKSPLRFYRNLIITSALILSSHFSLAKSVLADPTPPGTVIDNTATGSFTGETSGTTGTVTSNTVTLTVLEVAGITAAPSGNQEAAVGVTNAGIYQGVAGINTGDVVYFDFTVTNVGNDPTQFFIPDTATITGATLESIQLIAVDPDGAGAAASKTVAVNVPNTGGNTVTLLGATDGYIPVNGTVRVRVAVKVTETIVGNSISVILGDRPPNDNTAPTQNQVYVANGTRDLYTLDLADATTNPYPVATFPTVSSVPEATGVPANGDTTNRRQEASAQQSVPLAPTPVISGYKSVQLTTDADSSNTATPNDTLTWRVSYANTGTVDVINFQITDVLPTGVTLSGTLAASNITVNATQATAPSPNATYNGNGNNTLFASSITLKAGGVITVNIPVTINGGVISGTVLNNQPTANSNNLPAAGIKTDNIDNTTTGLPTDVTPLTNSIVQTQTAAIDPTRVTIGFTSSQTPLICDGRFYQIRATSNNSNLYLINRFTNPYSDSLKSSTPTGTVLNGLAYNPIDNYMYALYRGPDSGNTSGVTSSNALYRLDGSTIVSLGGITGLPDGFAPTAADFGPDGSYYVTRHLGSNELYKINVATRVATLITMSQSTTNIGDISYNPIDGKLYGIGGPNGTGNTFFKIDPVNGNVTITTLSVSATWGTTFFDPVGTFYAYDNDGKFYRIDTVTGVATLLSTALVASVSDGAVCQFTSEKIDVVKSAGTVNRLNATTFDVPYTVQVKNTSTFNAPNVQITENLNLTFSSGSPTISIQVAPAVTSGSLTINPSFNGTTSYNLLSGLNSLAGGASATITFTVRLVYPNAAAVPATVLNNQVYASTITSTTAPGTPNPGYTFPSNIPIPPPDLLTADRSTNGNTLPVSANGDTPSPTPVTLPSASNPNLLLVKRITAINGVPITTVTNDGIAASADDNANWPASALQGDITRNDVKPSDRLEYTIYFLSAGSNDVTNVTICDLVPPNTTFVETAFNGSTPIDSGGLAGGDLGIAFANSITTTPTTYMTNIGDGDRGRFYPSGTTPPPICKKPNTAISLTAADNTDGLVVINVVANPAVLPFATSSGVPANSYGFVRFQVKIK